MADRSFLLLGGAGLVGQQVARRIAYDLDPKKIIIASLRQDEVDAAVEGPEGLCAMFADRDIEWVGITGDIFVREEFTLRPRRELLHDESSRAALYEDLYGTLDASYERSRLASILREHRPDVIVDSINTATAISYQDVYTASVLAKKDVDSMVKALRTAASDSLQEKVQTEAGHLESSFETFALSLSVPQLIRHVMILERAMREAGTRLYLKIGTTGTGGMGMNIPYTHSEDKPSATLLTKSAIAFAHTGLMFLMARTVGGPIVKEVKPGAMIGYADVLKRTILERGQAVRVYSSATTELSGNLELQMDPSRFESDGELSLPVVDTGENGLFTRGEFEAITSVRQMEYMTPEEIALDCVLEIKGSNTGHDVIAAIDGAIMNSTYRAGVLRQQALDDLRRLEEETRSYSVALGQLGPPELSKLLWEAQLLKMNFVDLKRVVDADPDEIARSCFELVQKDAGLRHTITSIGLPILAPDGSRLIRGPRIRIPEIPGTNEVPLDEASVDAWARKGWVDLRPANFQTWQNRFARMLDARERSAGRGSAAMTRDAYRFDEIRIGAIVGWIFNNEIEGYRIK